jgi:SAM-dependent methyltransferase
VFAPATRRTPSIGWWGPRRATCSIWGQERGSSLRASVPSVPTHVASAERIPLPDASVDVITVGQAFHWFDHQRALPEMARVLRPRGFLALAWNVRDESEPWVARLSSLIGSEQSDDPGVEEPLARSARFGPIEQRAFRLVTRHDRGSLMQLVQSRSYCATRTRDEREEVLAAVGALYVECATPEGLTLPYLTHCFRSARL